MQEFDIFGHWPKLHDLEVFVQNLAGLAFAEDQLGFLAGVFAAQMTRTNKVGAICGPDSFAPAWRYCEGFKAGVAYINSPPEPISEEGTPTVTPSTNGLTASETPTVDDIPTDEPTPDSEIPTDGPPPTEESAAVQIPNTKRYGKAAQVIQAQDTQISPTPTPGVPVEATVIYHNNLGFKDSLSDPQWDADQASALILGGVDVIFGADSYGSENGAISAAAKQHTYAIGVNVDQYYTVTDAQARLLTSVIKDAAPGVFNLIRSAKNGNFITGNFDGTVGYAPYHDLSERVSGLVTHSLMEFQKGLASGAIETGVLRSKP